MRSVGLDAGLRCCVSLSAGAREKTRHLESEGPEGAKCGQHERSDGNQNGTGCAPFNGGDQQLAGRTIHVHVREFLSEAFVVFAFEERLRRACSARRVLRSQNDGDCDHRYVHRQRCERPDRSAFCRTRRQRRNYASPDALTLGGSRFTGVRGLCSWRARLRLRSL
eukprot:6174833-Pleurochrysis_carterae.AAC.2